MSPTSEGQIITKDIVIDGKTYIVTGTVDFKDISLKLKDSTPIPDPDPIPPDNIDPTLGTIKKGSRWSKNPGDPKTWTVVKMENNPNLWKILATDKLNVIADLPSKESAENLKLYFQNNPFPPKESGEGGGEDKEPIPVPKPSPGVDEIDGIKLPYKSTGKVRNDPYWNKRDDGLRLDYQDNPKDGSFVNNVTIFYGTFKDDIPDDEITFKWSWGNHSKRGDLVKTYGLGCNNKTGKTRYRMEWEHPSYTKNLAEGKEGIGLPVELGKSLGYMGVRKTLADGNVLLEYWQDRGGLDENGKPVNDWIKLLSTIDTEYKVTDYSKNGIECTVRLDDDDNGWENVKVEKTLCVEIE